MLYDLALSFGTLFALPKWLLQKKYRGSVLQRLGFKLPKASSKKPVIWMHMVSLGETRAMISIFRQLREKYPNGTFYLSSTTKTGHEEAKRSLPGAFDYFFLPLDLSWIMSLLIKRLQPDLFILSESDFWPNAISIVKKRGGKILVLNGKISSQSAARFAKFPRFASKTFNSIDHFYVQSQEHATRFASLNIPEEKISVIGNLKLANPTPRLTAEEKALWQEKLHLNPHDPIITLGSTHAGEEEALLAQLPQAKILVVPRHPERFTSVKRLLERLNNPQFILIDQMGVLPICYQLSALAIVGGSFIPGVGGHNIYEPIQAGIPVIFGPHTQNQKELAQIVLEAKAGIQTSIEGLAQALKEAPFLAANAKALAQQMQLKQLQAFELIKKHLPCP